MSFLPNLRGARVLLVSHELQYSGAPLFLVELGAEMQRSGATVTVVTLGSRKHAAHLVLRRGFSLCAVEESFGEASRAQGIVANTAVVNTWVQEFIRREPTGGERIIWWIHEIDTDQYFTQMEPSRQVKAVLFDSQASLEQWRSAGLQLPSLTRVIHLSVIDAFIASADQARFPYLRYRILQRVGIGPSLLTREAIRRKLGVGQDDFLLTLFVNESPRKGQELFMRTVGRLLERRPTLPLKVLLAGFGVHDRRDFLNRLSPMERRATGGTLRTWYFMEDLRPLYAASDAYVMNSQGVGENFGRVTTEAMAFHLPVLGTNRGGTPEIVVDGVTGLLHPVGEVGQEQLAEHIQRLVHDRELARRMGLEGRKRVCEYFNNTRFYAELGPVLDAVLNHGA